MTSVLLGGLLAVLGGVVGSVATYLVEYRIADRAQRFSKSERLRAERIAAYTAFASAVDEARRADMNRWWQHREAKPDSDMYREAKDESYRLRSAARQELFRLYLVSGDAKVERLAEAALQGVGDLHNAQTQPELEERASQRTEVLRQFVAAARDTL